MHASIESTESAKNKRMAPRKISPAAVRDTIWRTYMEIGQTAMESGKNDIAQKMFAAAASEVDAMSDLSELADSFSRLAEIYCLQSRWGRAKRFFKQALAASTTVLGKNDPRLVSTIERLADIYLNEGNNAQAILLYRRAIRILRLAHGPLDRRVVSRLEHLALVLASCGNEEEFQSVQRLLKRIKECSINDLSKISPIHEQHAVLA
jgi:tetratricopeptide (TPR) repeat protein